ncbi:uncharacterized protein LOC120215141 [Hibiscus syriacus]|uniref:uncharacterized protein LOC120215141 n=1 Tax=Hibiscus syriacus TaxID=106335 RepID=UPI0019218652|nr:uncharacterized protein LOC120215141 [Hibiscus syriacus]
MASRFQATTLVDSPSYPNSIAWSDENLIAVASGYLVTILEKKKKRDECFKNSVLLLRTKIDRGLISIPKTEPYPIGVVKREDLASGCLLPTTLSRDPRPYVRSISWSHLGMAPNSGCLLAVCTTEGRVKLYRPPFCDFGADWIEVLDITDRLYDYLASTSFEDPDIPPSEIYNVSPFFYPSIGEGEGPPKSRCMESEGRKSSHQTVPAIQTRGRTDNKRPEVCSLPLITADQYASRSAMLSSLVVAWSPLLKLSFEICWAPENNSSNCFSLLAFLGHHDKWALLASESSSPQVLLATGSSNGSVRIWITNIYAVPVSVLSLMPTQSLDKMLLAVGRTSGAFEVWIGDTSVKKFNKAGQYDAHDQVVTVLAWAFAGCSLYSCSKDNFVRSWNLHGSSLSEVPIPSSSPGMRSFSDIPDVFISCLGLVVSPSNLAVAMVRSFDVNQLDQMCEARLQKAVVEFFWIGGQQKDNLSSNSLEFDIEAFPCFTEKELVYWESNFLWSLKQYEHCDKPLVIWDIVAALSAFKQSAPTFVDHVLVKWLSISFVDVHVENSIGKILQHICKSFRKAASRQLHLLNIICRRVILSELKADETNNDSLNLRVDDASFTRDKLLNLWMELLSSSETEIRERLAGLSISAYKRLASSSSTSEPGHWYPLGIAQMEQWDANNNRHIHKQQKAVATKIKTHKRSRRGKLEEVKEQCGHCSASVPFDSPEFALVGKAMTAMVRSIS